MPRIISPKATRNIARILPFGLIWLITGWVFLLIEIAALDGNLPENDAVIIVTPKVFLFASIAVFSVGLLVGTLELIWLQNLFIKKSFAKKIVYKLVLYLLMMLVVMTLFYPLAASLETGESIVSKAVWLRYERFIFSYTFLSTLLQMSFSLLLCFIYGGISENLGHAVMFNFFTGKYHSPKEELRIFMFLDMKSSTTVAEKIGHSRFFELLKNYYSDLSDAIISHFGEVYQYVGDEIVISWPYKVGVRDNNCIECFFAMKRDLKKRTDFYMKTFDLQPTFKAGLHYGNVTTGEIGALKKEIIFTGDVLNTTARIQSLCNEYQTDFLISNELLAGLDLDITAYKVTNLGSKNLKGKVEPIFLSKVSIAEN